MPTIINTFTSITTENTIIKNESKRRQRRNKRRKQKYHQIGIKTLLLLFFGVLLSLVLLKMLLLSSLSTSKSSSSTFSSQKQKMIKKFFSTGLFLQHIKPVYSFVTESPNYRRHHHSSFSSQYHTPFVRLNQKSYYSTTSTALYSSSFSSSSSTSYEIGDLVEYKDDKKYHGGEFIGKVIEKRGSGWFSIQADHKNVKSTTIKRRAKDLKLVSPSSSNDSNNNKIKEQKLDLEEPLPFPPTPPLNINITDLDKILLHQNSHDDHTKTTTQASSMISSTTLSQAQYIASNYLDKKWVVFTDLHCSPSTLQTTIEILKKVHETALAHENAGVLFLGDFWHHRGSLHVPTLNAILDVLSNWTVPMIMIPGNHDQVTYKGEEHSLTPLR